VALIQSTSGVRGAVQIGVAGSRPARIEFLEVQGAGPTIVPKGRFSGWFDVGGRRLFCAAPATAAPRWCSRAG